MAVAICEGVVVAVVVVVVAVAVAVVVVVVVVVVVIVAVVVVVVMIVVAGVLGVLGFANWSLFTSSHDDTQHLHEERSLQRCFFIKAKKTVCLKGSPSGLETMWNVSLSVEP